jgi:hypothetical protein
MQEFSEHSVEENSASYEFSGISLGDSRLNKRAMKIVEAMQYAPDKKFTQLFKDASQSKAAYRFISNKTVESEEIIKPHQELTIKRAASSSVVLVIHDTTDFKFSITDADDLGVIDPSNQLGFYAHVSFCLDGSGQPLGISRIYAWNRFGTIKGGVSQSISQYMPDREMLLWNEAVHEVDDRIKSVSSSESQPTIVHVMDRGADCMELMSDMMENNRYFVIRVKNDRRLEAGRGATENKLFKELTNSPALKTEKIQVISYKATKKCDQIANPKREGGRERKKQQGWMETRSATLEIKSIQRTIYSGNGGHAHIPDKGLNINFVAVQEVDPPAGFTPICWYLQTNLPIETLEQAESIIKIYQNRWIIEEYFKAIKTGCEYESHQFGSGEAFVKVLMLYIPIAFQMLRMRWLERFQPNTEVCDVLSCDQMSALKAYQQRKGKPLNKNPKISEILLLIATLGGYIKRKEPPGWLVILRGFTFLNDITIGWQAARDQFLNYSSNDTEI